MATILVKADFEGSWTAGLHAVKPDLSIREFPNVGDVSDIEYALVWKPPVGLLASLPNLKVIYSIGAGIDHLAVDPDLPKDIPVVRMVDPSLTSGMASYVSWAAMHLHRNVFKLQEQQRAKAWIEETVMTRESEPSTVGILGLGNLGQACAEQLLANRFRVVGWSQTEKSVPGVKSFTGADGMDAMLRQSDICVCLLPLTSETAGILNAENLSKLRRGGGLINVGRGPQLVEGDVLALLDSGHLSGAILDVFHTEPLPEDNPLWNHPNVLVTPHIGSVTDPMSAGGTVAASIQKFEEDGTLSNTVDWAKGY